MTIITIHLACDPETDEVDPGGPVLIIGPNGFKATGKLMPGELARFAGDKHAQFEAELVDNTWRPIRRAGTN